MTTMTKRRDELIPLTHDHHHALKQARHMIAAATGDAGARREVAEGFLRFFEEDTLAHFREEEEVLFPLLLLNSEVAPQELITVLIDHVHIHGLVARLRESVATGDPDAELMRTIGESLRAHVRLEENELFPMIEALVPDEELAAVAFAPRSR
jgi:iron-sulfur cluster repair protein YtfE (RIC family)